MVDSDLIDALGRALGVRVIIIVGECIDDLVLRRSEIYMFTLRPNLHTSLEQIQIPGKDRLEFGRVPSPVLSDSLAFSSFYLAF
jgi:hypothetical protein